MTYDKCDKRTISDNYRNNIILLLLRSLNDTYLMTKKPNRKRFEDYRVHIHFIIIKNTYVLEQTLISPITVPGVLVNLI